MQYLSNLNYGRTNQSYELLYDAILCLKEAIPELQYNQYFINNLFCPGKYKITITPAMQRIIAWTLSTEGTLAQSFIWNEISAPTLTTYTIPVGEKYGFNFLYFSVPQGIHFTIYNALDMVLFDSALPYSSSQLFHLVGVAPTSVGTINDVYIKNDVYNSTNAVTFKLKLH